VTQKKIIKHYVAKDNRKLRFGRQWILNIGASFNIDDFLVAVEL